MHTEYLVFVVRNVFLNVDQFTFNDVNFGFKVINLDLDIVDVIFNVSNVTLYVHHFDFQNFYSSFQFGSVVEQNIRIDGLQNDKTVSTTIKAINNVVI